MTGLEQAYKLEVVISLIPCSYVCNVDVKVIQPRAFVADVY
jgi:hypothetical protein